MRVLRITVLIFFISGVSVLCSGFPPFCSYAEENTIRHEVTTGIRWISDKYTSDNYIANGIPSPASGDSNKEYLQGTISYSFFFAPVVNDQNTPLSLQRFYAHPNTLSINLSYQPEQETTEQFSNPERN
jgi:hypothetical protein